MIILPSIITLYGKKVITDLIGRDKASTPDNFSYGIGAEHVLLSYWPHVYEEEANIAELFERQSDFNAHHSQPFIKDEEEYSECANDDDNTDPDRWVAEYNPAKDPIDFNRYYRKLEDIPMGYLYKYIGNVVYGIRYNNTGGIRTYSKSHKDQYVFTSGDDDDFMEASELLLAPSTSNVDIAERNEARNNITYVMKRLHNMSMLVRIHMVSYARSYMVARQKNEYKRVMRNSKMTLKTNAVIAEGVWKCSKTGELEKRFVPENKSKLCSQVFDWADGVDTSSFAGYYKDFTDFIHYLTVLNIDIINDDFTQYDSEFMSHLDVLKVTPNDQYNVSVYNAIKDNAPGTLTYTEQAIDLVSDKIDLWQQIIYSNFSLRMSIENMTNSVYESVMRIAISVCYRITSINDNIPTLYDTAKYNWQGGYLYYGNDLIILAANHFSPYGRELEDYPNCIISETGFIIVLDKLPFARAMTIWDAQSNYNHRCEKVTSKDFYVDWRVYQT